MGIFKRFISRRKEDLVEKEAKRQEIFSKVKEVVTKVLELDDKDKVTFSSQLTDDLAIDSLTTVELVMELEEQFSIEIPDKDAELMRTVKDIVDYIELTEAIKQRRAAQWQRKS
jgi:acyl carrier protein